MSISFWRNLAALLALLLVPGAAMARPQEPPLDVAALRAHIDYLASDELEGRAPGTAGADKTVAYIIRQFEAAGLAPGGRDGGWLQPVDLVERAPVSASGSWRARGRRLPIDREGSIFVARDEKARLKKAKVVFAGYGIDPPSDIDLKDKVVLLLPGRPEGAETAPSVTVRREAIVSRGAAAVIIVSGASDPWDVIREQLGQGRTTATRQPHALIEAALSHAAWSRLLAALGTTPEALSADAAKSGFRPYQLDLTLDLKATSRVRHYQASNVIGHLGGASAAGEAVLFLAHWDHLGLCRPPSAADRICNGAVDNASGVAVLIEVARRLASGTQPPRSLYFVATTAEEMGLLGARALVRDPPLPLDRIVAAFNFDTVAIADVGEPVATIGRGETRLDPLIDAAAIAQGRKIDSDEAANAFITRQDGWALLEAGVPSVMVGGAFSDVVRLGTFLSGDYHQPSDQPGHPIPLEGAAEDGALHVLLGRMVADPEKFPAPSRSPR